MTFKEALILLRVYSQGLSVEMKYSIFTNGTFDEDFIDPMCGARFGAGDWVHQKTWEEVLSKLRPVEANALEGAP